VILTYNALTTLREVLDKAILSALNQDYPNFEVIVVDNASSDGTYEYVKEKYGNAVKVIKLNKNYGFCLGNNLALRFVDPSSKYILFQNPDAILAENYLSVLVEIMERNPDVAAMQGLELHPLRRHARMGGTLNSAGYYVLIEAANQGCTQHCLEPLFVFGAAMLVRRSVFERVGGFPSDYFLYHDEADLCLRLRAFGFRVLAVTATKYYHLVGGTVSKIQALNLVSVYFYARNSMLTVLKYFYGLHLVRALILNGIYLVTARTALRRRLMVRAMMYCLHSMRKIIQYRKIYVPLLRRRRVLERFIVRTR